MTPAALTPRQGTCSPCASAGNYGFTQRRDVGSMNVLLFVASPGDVAERHGPVDQVAAQFNATLGHNLEATLKIIRWETDAPRGPAERPQGAINPLLDQSDIMLGIFWRRCGTPSGV